MSEEPRRLRFYGQVRSTADRLERAHENIGRALSEAEMAAETLDGKAGGRRRRRQGLEKEVVAHLDDGATHRLSEIATALDHPQPSVSAALLMLMQDGTVERTGKGLYRRVARKVTVADRAVQLMEAELEAARQRVTLAEAALAAARGDVARVKESLLQLRGPRKLLPVNRGRFAIVQSVALDAHRAQRQRHEEMGRAQRERWEQDSRAIAEEDGMPGAARIAVSPRPS